MQTRPADSLVVQKIFYTRIRVRLGITTIPTGTEGWRGEHGNPADDARS
jgi:hypothetical protein